MTVVDYSYAPPSTWNAAWRNQFFVYDALVEIERWLKTDTSSAVLLDSDVVWTGFAVDDFWKDLDRRGSLTYAIDYPVDSDINGLSRRQLTALASDIIVLPDRHVVRYCGGEFIAATRDNLAALNATARELWPIVMRRHVEGLINVREEAHLLSLAVMRLGLDVGGGNAYIKRLWTQPLKPRNVTADDSKLALWHVPAEKRYGLRRLYRQLSASYFKGGAITHAVDSAQLAKRLGIPYNTLGKTVADVGAAARSRLVHKLG
ncbi:hypothetical protein ABC795_01240 [Blastococcus sp. HT6-30]|uniref:hypothetical protein n=1 Tax=Blastococcus sp. HT6-30 TaxID=3144843 RepID=UPI00321A2C32